MKARTKGEEGWRKICRRKTWWGWNLLSVFSLCDFVVTSSSPQVCGRLFVSWLLHSFIHSFIHSSIRSETTAPNLVFLLHPDRQYQNDSGSPCTGSHTLCYLLWELARQRIATSCLSQEELVEGRTSDRMHETRLQISSDAAIWTGTCYRLPCDVTVGI